MATLVVGTGFTIPAAAPAAVTFGNNLTSAPNSPGFNCNNTHYCTIRNAALGSLQTATGGVAAPFSGVIVRWRARTGTTTAPLTLRVIHPVGGGFTGAGTSESVTPPTSQVSPPFPTRLPIIAGDSIGLNCCQAGSHDVIRVMGGAVGTLDFWGTGANQPLADGESPPRNFDATNMNTYELLVNADLEADADGDGFGDETQDLCPTNASTQGACPIAAPVAPLAPPTTKAKKCKRKKKPKPAAAAKKCKRKKKR